MMDLVLEEDVTVPGTLSGCSGLVPSVPDDLDGINPNAGLGNGLLPNVSEETVSPTRARNMKDFENQITELKKENFNLKLRIYFLEERMQQEFHGPTEHIYKTNIELKVEVESLKRELQEREQLLIKASKAVESLAEAGGSEIQRVKEDARKKVQQVEDLLTKRILLLEKDVTAAQAELEKAFAGTETEKALRLRLESKLSEMKKMHEGDLAMALVLDEKDRLIEELKLSLKSKEALIQCLKEEKSQMACPDENVSSGELRGLCAAPREEKERETEAAQMEHQKERNSFEERIQALEEDLREKEREIATEKKNSLKRDKAIQGLTMALKSKEKKVEELNSEIEKLSAAFAKAREALQKAQTQEFQGSEDYETALSGKEALSAALRSQNLTKSTENHRLRRSIKKITQELSDLQQERERLEKDLEEAHREKSKGDCTIRDLRNEVEKLRNEVNEREKAMENRYKSLLSESNKKLHNQEQVIKHLTESTNQKDVLLQKFNEKDLEVIQQNCYLMAAEDLELRSEGLITEKCSSQQPPGSKTIFSKEKKQSSDYEELIQVLKKEQDIYTHLVKSLQESDSINNLQAELNKIFALRKQLEQDVLSYQNLRKTLEEQISEIRRREEESFSLYSDQTSYLSICLEENNRFQVEHFSQEELKKKVSDLIQLVKELYTDNQHLKKTIFDLSCMGFQGNGFPDRLASTEQTEEAKKSRLPILIKPSRSLGNMYRLPATQEVVTQLQSQILELQGELKEFKTCNKQLHQKLILAEAVMEGRPTPDKTLLNAQPPVGAAYQDSPGEQKGIKTTSSVWRDKEMDSDQQRSYEIDSEICPPDDLASLPSCKENPEDVLSPTSVATYLSSKSQPSAKVSVMGTDQSESINTSNETEYLKQKIHDLETELEGYQNFIFQLQKHSQCSEAIITVLCGTEGAQDGLSKPKNGSDGEEMTFSSLHQVRYVKHVKILGPLAPEMIDSRVLENLKQQLEEQEYKLQKEQNLNMQLFSEIHNLQNKFRDLSPPRYDSLVQSQARELSLQRQQIKDGHGICVISRQHMNTMIKAFEELLQASDVDYCVAEGFQEQLNQCAELLEKLEKLFLNGKSVGVEMNTQNELMERIEEDNLTYQHLLPESPEPSASHALSDYETSEKSFFSRDQKQDNETEKTSVMVNSFSQDLLMEHIQEIRTLRKRLEESIKTNEKLRKQLERQGSEFVQGSTSIFASGSELHSSLTSEIHFLRKQNQALNAMLIKGSRDKQKENDKLRESLSRKTVSLEHLQREYASVKEENERLQKEGSEKERHNQQLIQEVRCSGQELSRVQEEVKLRQQLLSQNDKLLQSLRVELKAYEKLDEEHRRLREASGEGWKGQDPFRDLHSLLMEIQALRLQLERSIETSSTLQSRLKEQLARGAEKAQEGALTLAVQAVSIPEVPLQPDKHDGDKYPMESDNSFDLFDSSQAVTPKSVSETPPLSGNDTDSLSCDSGSSATSTPCVSRLVTGHHLWASKNGRHVLGLIEDYEALLKQISQGQRLLAEMDIQTQEAPSSTSQELGTKGPHPAPLSKFVSSVSTAKLTLEEAYRRLKLLWRVSLPEDGQCPLHCEQIGEMKAEVTKLHKKLFEQEKKLQNTMKLLQLSKRQEKVIFDQLVVTHKILRKARGNLELRPGGAHPGTCSPSRPGS
ncbi:CDK5 regulatory subunit-associated protein 2 isoform X4 [Homo sapiens]|uniref:CDK5 regulatory subunit-associated protein 2 isoform X4 n=1 Tax=Homo sapiens TaxID=9606 RepID=UPI0003EAF3E3|nr:CDK5 regulatory subunit-associated protein 2 isoform X4 [Homo sapiens]|eukprot:XP_006717248.1 CDK5 regulatory subunit-associated protein 2 isoform X4 [Homo sapiens]